MLSLCLPVLFPKTPAPLYSPPVPASKKTQYKINSPQTHLPTTNHRRPPTNPAPFPTRVPARRPRSLTQPALLQLTLRNQGLLSPLQLRTVRVDALEQRRYCGAELRGQRRLGAGQGDGGGEFEMLFGRKRGESVF
jgi:hypothetical protein